MVFRRVLCLATPVLALAAILSLAVWAAVFGSVRGVVHDPDHRPVHGAQVVLKSASSDYSQTLRTDPDGSFEAAAVPVGAYHRHRYARWIRAFGAGGGRSPPAALRCCTSSLRSDLRSEEVTVSESALAVNPGADDADHHRQPQRNRDHARRGPEQQPEHDHRLRSRRVDDARPASRARRPSGDLGDRRRSHPEHQHREQRRAADRSRRISTTWKRSAAAIPPRTATGPTACSTSFRGPGFERNNEGELFTTFGTFHQTNDQVNFGSHTEKFAYFASVNGNRSDYGLETPGPDVLHDRVWGLGGMGTLIYNRDANNQFRFVTSRAARRLSDPQRSGCPGGRHPRRGARARRLGQLFLGAHVPARLCCSPSRRSITTTAPITTATQPTRRSAPRSTADRSTRGAQIAFSAVTNAPQRERRVFTASASMTTSPST